MPAHDESQLEEKLSSTGIWLIEARLQKIRSTADTAAGSKQGWLSPGIRRRDLIEFCTLMTFQIRVGVVLMHALEVARQDCANRTFRAVIAGLRRHVEAGLLFYEALEKYPKVFTPHFISVVRAGEMSSKLPEAFEDLRNYLEWVEKIIADVRQASLYPAIVLTVVSAFVVGLFTFIIPKFADLLISVNVELPLLTRIIFGVSGFVRATWWVWFLVIPGLVAAILIARKVSKGFALLFDAAKFKLPIFGELNWMLAISRFTHNFSILYRSGIPILQSLNLCQHLTGSHLVDQAVGVVETDVKGGSILSEALRKHRIFPPLLIRMVVMGETTGRLDEALDNVSNYYNDIIPRRIKKVLTMLEPMLTLFLILVVGCVALSIYLPILSLMSAIKG
jgi:type IV pilus assembly protein PilC